MSTRSRIIVINGDNAVSAYCHYDGYHDGVGSALLEHYNDFDAALALAELGGFRAVEANIEDVEAHADFDPHVDRAGTIYEMRSGEQFAYIFAHDRWYVTRDMLRADRAEKTCPRTGDVLYRYIPIYLDPKWPEWMPLEAVLKRLKAALKSA